MKASEFLNDLDPHGIYDAEESAKDFKTETGLNPVWPTHTMSQTVAAIVKRGLGGRLNERGSCGRLTERGSCGRAAYGWEVAEGLAAKLGNYKQQAQGRGRRFFDAVAALAAAGH